MNAFEIWGDEKFIKWQETKTEEKIRTKAEGKEREYLKILALNCRT